MKNLSMTSVVVAIMTIVPALSFASTYQYVDTNGNVSAVNASSPAQALTVSNIDSHSGVILTSNSLNFTSFVPAVSGTYQYVDVYGNVKTVNAGNASQALSSSDIAPHSGVILMTGTNGL